MVGDPSLCEAVKLIELRLGIVFRIVAHINPVKHELLDLVAGKVRVQFLDALNGLLKIEPFCVTPDQLASLGVELHVLQQIPEHIVNRLSLMSLYSGSAGHWGFPGAKAGPSSVRGRLSSADPRWGFSECAHGSPGL